MSSSEAQIQGWHGQAYSNARAVPQAEQHGHRSTAAHATRFVLLLLPFLLTGCQGFHSSLDPAGPMAGEIFHVIRIFLWVTTPIYVLVVVFSILAILRIRSRVDLQSDPIFMPQPEAN